MNRVEVIAAACYHVGLAYDGPGPVWQDAPEWQRSAVRHAVRFWDELDLEKTPFEVMCAATHVAWMNHKLRDGWQYGPVEDAEKKGHPCLVSYAELPKVRRAKDAAVLRTYLALRALYPPEES